MTDAPAPAAPAAAPAPAATTTPAAPAPAPAAAPAVAYSPDDYTKATKLNARLAALHPDASLIDEARQLANKMLDYVKSKTKDYDAFVAKVNNSEQYALTESRQPAKEEKQLKVIYLRAASLLETVNDAAERLAKKRA